MAMNFEWAILVIIVFSIFCIVSINIFFIYDTQCDVVCSLESKERINDGDSSKYLIFCEEEVFENTDQWLVGKFNSSDFYKNLKIGKKYNLKVCGWRIPFLSWYRNIIKIPNAHHRLMSYLADNKEYLKIIIDNIIKNIK